MNKFCSSAFNYEIAGNHFSTFVTFNKLRNNQINKYFRILINQKLHCTFNYMNNNIEDRLTGTLPLSRPSRQIGISDSGPILQPGHTGLPLT